MAQFTLFYKKNKEAQRGLSHTIGLLSSSALQGRLERLKRSTPGREKRFSLETSRDNYKTGSVQFRVHRALGVISERSVLLPTAFAAGIRMMSPLDAPRSPVVAVRPDFSAKVDEDVWSAHQRGSRALVSSSRCCRAWQQTRSIIEAVRHRQCNEMNQPMNGMCAS